MGRKKEGKGRRQRRGTRGEGETSREGQKEKRSVRGGGVKKRAEGREEGCKVQIIFSAR